MSKGNEQGGGNSGPGGGGGGKGREKIMVSVNSIDGNIKRHPFDATDTVGDVHRFSYDKLVQQKDQITLDRTWIEFNGDRVDDSRVLSTLAGSGQGHGGEIDLVMSLSWDTSGG